MKANTLLLLFTFFIVQINAQDSKTYTQSGTSFFLQVGPTNNLYSELVEIGTASPFFNAAEWSVKDRSISMGLALELVRGNVGFRLQTNRIKIDETYEFNSSTTNNDFGQFTSRSAILVHGQQINYEVIPGVHRYFQINKWLFSGGIETPFTIYDIYQYSRNDEVNFFSSNGGFTFQQETTDDTTGELPGGYDVGLGINLGLQYALNNTIKIAIQYAPSIRHYKIGGETELIRKNKQKIIEQFEDEPVNLVNNFSTVNIMNTNTREKTADFRQGMTFALVFSF